MTNQTPRTFSLLFLTLLLTLHFTGRFSPLRLAGAGKVRIPDDLDDVIDDEEDDDWKNWGKKRVKSPEFDLDPSDLDKMEPSQIQAEFMKRQTGPVFGFIKLRLGVKRTPDVVSETAMKWTKVLKTGGLEVKFMGVDVTTIMFSMESGQDMDELKEFILEQPDAYEVKIGDNVYRRPGDPPLEEVIVKLRSQKAKLMALLMRVGRMNYSYRVLKQLKENPKGMRRCEISPFDSSKLVTSSYL